MPKRKTEREKDERKQSALSRGKEEKAVGK